MTRDPKVVRAAFDDDTAVVYQAYAPAIAEEALARQTFGPSTLAPLPRRAIQLGIAGPFVALAHWKPSRRPP